MNAINRRAAMRWLAFAVVLLLLTGCRTKYVPVETVKRDSIYMTLHIRDSVYMRDSIYIREKGDTVYKYRDRYLFVESALRDTAYIERRDSVEVPYPVEKQLTKWQRWKMDVGEISLIANLLTIGLIIVRWIRKKGGMV